MGDKMSFWNKLAIYSVPLVVSLSLGGSAKFEYWLLAFLWTVYLMVVFAKFDYWLQLINIFFIIFIMYFLPGKYFLLIAPQTTLYFIILFILGIYSSIKIKSKNLMLINADVNKEITRFKKNNDI